MVAVVLALECSGFADVRAYEVQPSREMEKGQGGGRASAEKGQE
jgi:hypothetical protein